MIINGSPQLEVGKKYISGTDFPCHFTDGTEVPDGQPFLVLGMASKEEYLEFCKQEGFMPGPLNEGYNFYRVSVD
jgi:hypothetical protein